MPPGRTYIAIDLKSFYASVECIDRGLDPLRTHLVVADASRTEKTICLAVSPSLKVYGIPGRARLFEVVQKVHQVNARRRPGEPPLEYIIATPRMARYVEVSRNIYNIYLRHVAPDDIHVYSVDEVFIDATQYLRLYKLSPHDFAMRLVRDVLTTTGITATAGIGTNLYLAKIAMDIEAKHSEPDADGVRVAALDETTYRQRYWSHRPLTDFWRIGRGIAAKLEANGMFTMGDIARASLGQPYQRLSESLLYKLFGVNAELIIDHAWGWEPCTIADIKAYRPSTNSLSSGQVLHEPYTFAKARVVTREMADMLVMELVGKHLVTDHITLTVSYDKSNLDTPDKAAAYQGPVASDRYGRNIPKPAHGSITLDNHTSSTRIITDAVISLYDRIVNSALTIRYINIAVGRVINENEAGPIQLSLFDDNPADTERERRRQEAILAIRRKFGKNAILSGFNFEEGATARERNQQLGGHKA